MNSDFMHNLQSSLGNDLKRIWNSTLVQQAGLVYSSQILVLLTSLVSAIIVPRALGPDLYGDLTFVTSFLLATQVFFDLGVSDSSARLLASVQDHDHQARLSGGISLLFLGITAIFSMFVFFAGSWVDPVFNTQVGLYLQATALAAGAFLIRDLVGKMCKGLNRVREIFLMLAPPAFGYISVLILLDLTIGITITRALLGKMVMLWIAVLVAVIRLRPRFNRFGESLKEIWADVRSFGFKVYTGRAFHTAASMSDKLFIGLMGSTTSVGFYYLARIIVQPVEFFPSAVSTSLFRRFGSSDRIPRKIMLIIMGWMVLTSGGLLVLGRPVVGMLFSEEFSDVLPMMFTAIIGAVLGGLVHPFNAFLAVKGYGEELRRISLILAFYILSANFVLIAALGAMGAVYAFIGEKAISLALHGWHYRRALQGAAPAEKHPDAHDMEVAP